jgi:hypothetical protein
MDGKGNTATDETLGQLVDILGVARELARELCEDPLLRRLNAVFQAMPPDDRPVIIEVLEREVTGRTLSRNTEKPVGQSTHVNPNARLYVRAHDTQLDPRHFDREQMHVANVRAMRIALLIRHVPGIYALFKEALRSAMDEVDEPTRAVAEELLHDVLAAIGDARATATAADPSEPTPEPAEPVTRERPGRS